MIADGVKMHRLSVKQKVPSTAFIEKGHTECVVVHERHIVTWYPTETIEIRLILSSRRNEQWQTVKDTVKKECRSQRGYQQMLVLSNLRSPDTGREKEREAKWLAGTLKRKWHLLPVGEKKNEKKNQLLEGARGRQTYSHYSGWRRQKHILDTRDPSSSSQC